MPQRDKKGRFLVGNSGGGRTLGARAKLTETMVRALADDAEAHAAEVIAQVRTEKPHLWLAAMIALLPREVKIEKLSPFNDISDEELEQLEQHLAAQRARLVREIEQHTGVALELEPEPVATPVPLPDDVDTAGVRINPAENRDRERR